MNIAQYNRRNYDFIKGTDILNYLNALINIASNKNKCTTVNNPYNINEIGEELIDGIKLGRLNSEKHKEIISILKRFKIKFFAVKKTTKLRHAITTTKKNYFKLYGYPTQHEEAVR